MKEGLTEPQVPLIDPGAMSVSVSSWGVLVKISSPWSFVGNKQEFKNLVVPWLLKNTYLFN